MDKENCDVRIELRVSKGFMQDLEELRALLTKTYGIKFTRSSTIKYAINNLKMFRK